MAKNIKPNKSMNIHLEFNGQISAENYELYKALVEALKKIVK